MMKIAEKEALPVSAGKHAPGPWKIDYKKFSDIKTADGAIVATCNNLTGLCNMKNNARLIAAAPDMLDALQFVTGASRLLPEAMLKAVKDAIAKALGESQ